MGCATSKIDDLPAVVLCRERLTFLDQTLHHRYTFAESHLSYIHSLSSVGDSLHRFFAAADHHPPPPSSPPPHRKSEATPAAVEAPAGNPDSGHLHFHSDDDSDDDGSISDGSLHHDSAPSSPRMYPGGPNGFDPYSGAGGGGVERRGEYMHMNYMRKQVTPSVSYQQKPVSTETIHQFGDPSSSSSNYNNNNNNYPAHQFYAPPPQNNNPSSYYDYGGNNYGNNYGYMNYGGGGFFGAPAGQAPVRVPEAGWGSSSSKPTPPPPPPPPPASTSGWDFLSIFESSETNYPPYSPSRDSREVREEEGIPDLEDEGFEHEVVKEVDVNLHQKFVDENGGGSSSSGGDGDGKRDSKRVEVDEDVGKSKVETGLNQGRPSVSTPESTPVEYEVHMVEKKVVGGVEEQQGKGGQPGFRNVFEVVREIQVQFERASASGGEIGKVLEVGKLRYQRKNAAYQVSSKMLRVSLPSTSRNSEALLDRDEEVQLRSVNLSATLQKLYLWEKKLFEEVKVEEKMRVEHDRKLQKWKRMEEKGSEPTKIDILRSEVRGLSTKIRIAIQIVDRISEKINKLRDEELWPLLNELIQGLSRMWKAMLECHHNQCRAIIAANGGLDAIAFPQNPSDAQLEATLQFEHDLINWTCKFTDWVASQKGFVRSLNGWLFKCLLPEPEVTADGIAPFSPGRAGAPPIFVICNHWNQSLERISETSEKEVVDSMRVFAMMVWHLRERDKGEMRQRMAANKDMERKVKNLEREDMKMQKEIQSLDKRIALSSSGGSENLSLSGNVVYQSDTSSKTSLQAGLLRIFEALDKFTADSVKTYEELVERSEEVAREHGKVA